MKITRRQLRRIIKEIRSPDDNERSDTFKLIKLFLSDGGAVQAMELAEMLPDADTDVIDMFSVIEARVEEIIQIGRGDFPEFWNPGGGRAVKEPKESEYVRPLMQLVKELRDIARSEIDGPGHDSEFAAMGTQVNDLYKQARYALSAASSVVTGEYTPEEMIKDNYDGKYFVALAERFGLDYESIA